jgi:hypothetical protein
MFLCNFYILNDDILDVGPTNNDDFETLSAKFHFVDLAGSERLKRLVKFIIFHK